MRRRDVLQEIIAKAVSVEEKKEKEEKRLKRALDDMFPKAADAPTHVRFCDNIGAEARYLRRLHCAMMLLDG